MESVNKYSVEFTEKQLRVVAIGLEFYSRFLAGQWEIPDAMVWKEFKNQEKYEGFWEKRNHVQDQLKSLKSIFTGLPLNASYGIGSDEQAEETKIAYDIYRPIWEEFAKGAEHWTVYSHAGFPYSNEGRIKIVKKDETS